MCVCTEQQFRVLGLLEPLNGLLYGAPVGDSVVLLGDDGDIWRGVVGRSRRLILCCVLHNIWEEMVTAFSKILQTYVLPCNPLYKLYLIGASRKELMSGLH